MHNYVLNECETWFLILRGEYKLKLFGEKLKILQEDVRKCLVIITSIFYFSHRTIFSLHG